jgi:hypothetical protein
MAGADAMLGAVNGAVIGLGKGRELPRVDAIDSRKGAAKR